MPNFILTLADNTGESTWYTLRFTDLVMILAVLAAPWIAVYIQRRLDTEAEKRSRKRAIFRTLMATRATRVSGEHVAALNMIDIEFYGEPKAGKQIQTAADNRVVAAWRVYLESLDFGLPGDLGFDAKVEQSREKFGDLLFEMSRALGYNFDKVLLKKGVYSPVAHNESELDNRQIRQGLARILSGEAALGVTTIHAEEAIKQNKKINTALAKMLDGTQPLSVRIADSSNDRQA